MAENETDEEPEGKKPPSPAKIGILGGLFAGLGSVMVAQRVSADVESSMELTLLVVVVGACVGGAVAFLAARAMGKSPPKS